jgi:hypothetical protein
MREHEREKNCHGARHDTLDQRAGERDPEGCSPLRGQRSIQHE